MPGPSSLSQSATGYAGADDDQQMPSGARPRHGAALLRRRRQGQAKARSPGMAKSAVVVEGSTSGTDGDDHSVLVELQSFPPFRDSHSLWRRSGDALARVVSFVRSSTTSLLRPSPRAERRGADALLSSYQATAGQLSLLDLALQITVDKDDYNDYVYAIRLPTPEPGV